MAFVAAPVIAFSPQGGTPGQSPAAGAGNAASCGTAAGVLPDAVTIPAGSALVFGSGTPLGASLDLATTGSVTCWLAFTNIIGGAQPAIWFRADLYQAANPAVQHQVFACLSGGIRAADVSITTAGKVLVRAGSGGTTVTTSTASVPLGVPYRIEGFITGSATAGQTEVKLFASRSAAIPVETNTSAANLNTTGAPDASRFGLATGGSAGLSWSMGTCAVSAKGYIGGGAIVNQMACGAPAAGGFTVTAKPIGGTSLRLKVATDAALTQNVTYAAAQAPDAVYGYTKHAVTGLSPATRYWCQLLDTVDGAEIPVGPVGTCRTLPAPGIPASFTVALGSCVNTAVEPGPDGQLAIADWLAYQADLNIFTGDFDYEDPGSTSVAAQAGLYEFQAGWYGAAAMLAGGWGYYCRSDHDSSNADNGDSDNAWTAANIAAAQAAFPFGTLGDTVNSPVHGLYQSWAAGRVRFIMTDVRNTDRSPGAAADNASKTMLGAAQLAWLKTQLVQAEPLKVVISDTAWMGAFLASDLDKWWSYDTERQAIISYIAANRAAVQNVMWWHGDTHCVGACPGASNPWGGWPVYCAAPLRQTGAAVPNAAATFPQLYNNGGGECRQYGRIRIADDGYTITVAFQGWDAVSGVARVTQTDTFPAFSPGILTASASSGINASSVSP